MGVIGGNRGEIHKGIRQTNRRSEPGDSPQADDHRRHPHPAAQRSDGRKLDDVKVLDTLMASADTVAADAYATTLFGMKPEESSLDRGGARKWGLGEMDLSKVKIVKA